AARRCRDRGVRSWCGGWSTVVHGHGEDGERGPSAVPLPDSVRRTPLGAGRDFCGACGCSEWWRGGLLLCLTVLVRPCFVVFSHDGPWSAASGGGPRTSLRRCRCARRPGAGPPSTRVPER